MDANWNIIGLVAAIGLILVVFLIRRNRKDVKDYERFLNKNEMPTEDDREEDELNNVR